MPELSREWLARKVVEATPDAVIFADTEGFIHLWNDGAERMFGYSADEALGQKLDLIIPERLRQRHWDAYHKSMAAGSTKYGASDVLAVPAVRKDGSRFSIEFTISLLRDEGGELLGPAAIIRDVTARWQEQTELRRRLAELEAAQQSAERRQSEEVVRRNDSDEKRDRLRSAHHQREANMCISCGCDEPEDNHGNPKHITLKQFREAAEAGEVDMPQLLRNIQEGFRRYAGVQPPAGSQQQR